MTREPHAPEAAQPLNMQAFLVLRRGPSRGCGPHRRPAGAVRGPREHAPSGWTGGPLPSPPGAEDPRAPGTHLHPNPDAGATVVPTTASSAATTSCGRFAASPTGGPSSPDTFASDITLVNWPMIDYFEGPVHGVEPAEAERHLLAPAFEPEPSSTGPDGGSSPDGGVGYPGLAARSSARRGRLAMRPYIRESRRIRSPLHGRRAGPRPRPPPRREGGAVRRQRRDRQLPHRPAPVHRRGRLRRHRLLPLRDPLRGSCRSAWRT